MLLIFHLKSINPNTLTADKGLVILSTGKMVEGATEELLAQLGVDPGFFSAKDCDVDLNMVQSHKGMSFML